MMVVDGQQVKGMGERQDVRVECTFEGWRNLVSALCHLAATTNGVERWCGVGIGEEGEWYLPCYCCRHRSEGRKDEGLSNESLDYVVPTLNAEHNGCKDKGGK